MEVDIFEKVKNGKITCTNEFNVKVISRKDNSSKKYNIYIALLNMIENKYIEGIKDKNIDLNYKNLKVTKNGLEIYNFLKTPINKIGKLSFLEICKNGIVGEFAGRLTWWLIATGILILIPTFNEDAKNLLIKFIKWILTLLS